MPDPIRLIAKRLSAMTYQVIDKKAQFIWGTVLSRNPDGTLNLDDGKGGCVLVVPPTNARVGDRVRVAKNAIVGGVGMPGVATYTTSIPQKNRSAPFVFIDDDGHVYNRISGALTGSGGAPTADIDTAFGYSTTGNPCFVGAAPSYNDLQIGDLTPNGSGYVGQVYSSTVTVICRGIGASSGILLGIEQEASTQYSGPPFPWTVVLRNANTFALIATNAATYISDWMLDHPADYVDAGYDVDHPVHVSADPVNGSFWLAVGANTGTATAPMFNVSSSDGSLLDTVVLDTSSYPYFLRANLVQPE